MLKCLNIPTSNIELHLHTAQKGREPMLVLKEFGQKIEKTISIPRLTIIVIASLSRLTLSSAPQPDLLW